MSAAWELQCAAVRDMCETQQACFWSMIRQQQAHSTDVYDFNRSETKTTTAAKLKYKKGKQTWRQMLYFNRKPILLYVVYICCCITHSLYLAGDSAQQQAVSADQHWSALPPDINMCLIQTMWRSGSRSQLNLSGLLRNTKPFEHCSFFIHCSTASSYWGTRVMSRVKLRKWRRQSSFIGITRAQPKLALATIKVRQEEMYVSERETIVTSISDVFPGDNTLKYVQEKYYY